MIRASLIALAAAAALTAGASSASAGVDVHIGFPGVYNPYYAPVYSPYYSPDYDDDCHYIKVKKWVWKNGQKHKVFVKKLVCY